jgi:hypothetical protein
MVKPLKRIIYRRGGIGVGAHVSVQEFLSFELDYGRFGRFHLRQTSGPALFGGVRTVHLSVADAIRYLDNRCGEHGFRRETAA